MDLIRTGTSQLSVDDFDARFDRARPRLLAVARSIIGPHQADDIVQDAYLAARSRVDQLRDIAALTPPETPSANAQERVISEDGHFIGSWSSDPSTPPINAVHEWILHIETADGSPVEGATVIVDGDMPAHGHGMPTRPEVTADLGDGDYRVEGMAFQMGGYWIVDVTVTTAGKTDVIRFGLAL